MNRKQRRAATNRDGPVPRAALNVQQVFADALRHHQAGRLEAAEPLYRQVVVFDARHIDSLHLLGLIAHQTGRHAAAVELIGKAIALNPEIAPYHSSLGNALKEQGRLIEAVTAFRAAIALRPDLPEAHNNLGIVFKEQGLLDEAAACYRTAIALRSNQPEFHNNLGTVLLRQERLDDAVACFREALSLRLDYAEAYTNLGIAFHEQGRLDDAVAFHRKAIALKPDDPAAHGNLGVSFKEQGHWESAAACQQRAIALKPDYAEAWNNLGGALQQLGRLEEAADLYRTAIALKPNYPEAHNNLGLALRETGQPDEAVACFRKSIEQRPGDPETHHHLAMALLARGDMAEGWAEYEWRWQTRQMRGVRRGFAQPQWRGEAAEGRTLLIHAEQGFGDTLQFCRYATLAAASGLRVIMEVPTPLVRLIRSLQGVDQVVPRGEELPPFDIHCPMLSMPLAMETVIATIPCDPSYLHADRQQVAAWRARLATTSHHRPRIGLVWAGSPRDHSPALAAIDRRRSMTLDRLAPLSQLPGLNFFSLQKGGFAASAGFPLMDFMAEMEDFADTAALIANLDLVISVDTAVAHLAAALGKPVWLLNRFDSCWRWLNGRRDSPWYPAMRLYPQRHPGDWDGVLAEIVRDLRGLFPLASSSSGESS